MTSMWGFGRHVRLRDAGKGGVLRSDFGLVGV